ncbi:hypothetical protein HZA33_01955 [Candidatus Pacearchaeota archaeon]|nr:hypothetical protein [Candidatus Pacearchaeota archaeon]
MIDYKKALVVASLAALAFMPSAAISQDKEKIDINKPRVLEFDYRKGETARYNLSAKIKVNMHGGMSGYSEGIFNAYARSVVINEDNGLSELEARIERLSGKSYGDLAGSKGSSELNWNVRDKENPIIGEVLKTPINFAVKKTGEISSIDKDYSGDSRYEQIIDFFPDNPVKLGDTWKSDITEIKNSVPLEVFPVSEEPAKTSFNDVTFKLSGETKYRGIQAFIIDFNAKAKLDEEGNSTTGEVKMNGKMFYDPIKKKILEINIKVDSKSVMTVNDDEEKRKPIKLGADLSLESSLKIE